MSEILNESMSSKEMLNILIAKNMDDARAAKKRGEIICWSSSIAPCEFLETMGIHTVYPENHCVGIAARGGADPLLKEAEVRGYSPDICSYARINLAYKDVRECISEELPLPDVVILCNNICNTLLKWYENLAYELDIPLLLIDVPYNHTDGLLDRNIKYVKDQFAEVIRQLEELTGNEFNYNKFQNVMEIASQNAKDWMDAMNLLAAQPSPLNGFDMFNYMGLIVCMRGKKECGMTFRKLKEELEEKIEKGECGLRNVEEKFRIMWDGIACWPYLRHTSKALKSAGVNLTSSVYPLAWALTYEAGDLNSLAAAYLGMHNNRSLNDQVDTRVGVCEKTHCDGIIFHMNRSCKVTDFLQYEMGEMLKDRLGIPATTFDGDQADPSNFSPAQYDTRVQSLIEMMEQQKYAK